jgi:hypothetical protein
MFPASLFASGGGFRFRNVLQQPAQLQALKYVQSNPVCARKRSRPPRLRKLTDILRDACLAKRWRF